MTDVVGKQTLPNFSEPQTTYVQRNIPFNENPNFFGPNQSDVEKKLYPNIEDVLSLALEDLNSTFMKETCMTS